MLKATVLSDNNASPGLGAEWGLSVFISYNGKHILLDTGASGLFLKNAEKLDIPLDKTDVAVVSHAHYDHGGGLSAMFEALPGVKAYLCHTSAENCYHKRFLFRAYIGLPKGVLKRYGDRIVFAEGNTEIAPGAFLVSHKTEGLIRCGEREKMFVRRDGHWYYDDFSHEQSLVLRTEKGLVLFNSCCHGGVGVIVREAMDAFPGERVYALVGGFHLYNKTEEEIRSLAKSIRELGIGEIWTGHCTKEKGLALLKEELGDMVHGFYAGCEITV